MIVLELKKLENSLKPKKNITNIYSIGFIDFMLKGKCLLEHTNLFSPNEYKKNDKIILKYFQ